MVANHMAQHVFAGLVESLNHTRCRWVSRCIKTRATLQSRKHFPGQTTSEVCALVADHNFRDPHVSKEVDQRLTHSLSG